MKKLILIASVFTISLFGCQDFLEEENLSNVSDAEFYVTEEGFASLINANYSQMREIFGQDPALFMAGTDLYAVGRGRSNEDDLGDYIGLTPSSGGVSHIYTNGFKAVQLANTGFKWAAEAGASDQQVGELHFFRALAYFYLVQTYGGVTIIESAVNEAVTSFDRNSAEEVYNLIISDFEMALASVGDGTYDGHVNKRAVNHFLAKAHLTRAYESFAASDDFSKAATYADAAIDGQALSLSFNEIWDPGNDVNVETIFSVQYDDESISASPGNLGSQQQNFMGSYLGGSEVAANAPYKSYTYIATNFALSLFEQGDERYEGTFMMEVFDRYWDYFDVDRGDHGTLGVQYFYEPPWFDATDKANYIAAKNPDNYYDFGTHDSDRPAVSNNFELIIVKKFDDPNSLFAGSTGGGRTSSRDFILARLADTYLLAAEAYLGAGSAGTALDRINEVRGIRGVADYTSVDIDDILDERARELFGEYHRWFDLKRTGKLVERAVAHHPGIADAAQMTGNNGEFFTLRPIPQRALDLNQNKSFAQNPAYN